MVPPANGTRSRCLHRGLAVLAELNRRQTASAAEIGLAINVPRPTVYRLLLALADDGYVRQILGSDDFTLRPRVTDLSVGWGPHALALEEAIARVDEIADQVGWPIDVCVFHAGEMVVRHSTYDRTGWSLHPRSPVGKRLPLCGTAPGRMYLAGLDHRTRAPFLGRSDDVEQHCVAIAEHCGYAVRNGGLIPRTTAIAVPVRHGRATLLCISMAFIRATTVLEDVIAQHVPTLAMIARRTENRLAEV